MCPDTKNEELDRNINVPKKMRRQPENTIVVSKSVNKWRTDFEKYGSHLRVLYDEGTADSKKNCTPGSKINFHTTDVVVSDSLNLKQPKDSRSKSILQHDWHRVVIDEDMLNKDTVDLILKMNVKKIWAVGKPSTSAKANLLYALLVGSAKNYSPAIIEDGLEHGTPTIEKLYPFGSKVVQTIPIQLTDDEKQIYLVAEIRLKQKLKDIKLSGQQLGGEVKKNIFRNLELSILRLREMVSSIPLAVKKGDIQGNSELMKKLSELKEMPECPICGYEVNIISVTKCGHFFCLMCIEDWCLKEKKCPCCREELNDDNSVFSAPLNCVVSTKANVLLDSLKNKSLIISKFDRLLNWLESFLREKGLKVHRMEAELFQNSSSEENVVFLADFEAISGEMDISSIHRVFFMEALKENEENAIINHITGVKGKRNEIFEGAYRLVVQSAVEGKLVGLKGDVEAGFKELNMKEVEKVLT